MNASAIPAPGSPTPESRGDELACRDLTVEFPGRAGGAPVTALHEVTVSVPRGRVVGVVGESGSGKSTLARCLVGLQKPTAGQAWCGDIDIAAVHGPRRRKQLGERVAMVFQDPRSSLNPRITVGAAVADPLVVHGVGSRDERHERVRGLLADVGLPESVETRKVRELSGGQLQRVAIARALALNPHFLVADEPTSALDVSVQAQILNLLADLRQTYGFGMIMISHDMRVIRAVSDETVVMLGGEVVEHGPTEQVFSAPATEYARELIGATPTLGALA